MPYIGVKLIWKLIEKLDHKDFLKLQRPSGITVIKDISYMNDTEDRHKLDIAMKSGINTKQPVILNIHGGGWVYGSKEELYEYYGMGLAQYGYAVVSINYSLAPEWIYPSQITEVFHALDFIYYNADRYGFDTEQVFIVGDSAGANLAALAGIIVSNGKIQDVYKLQTQCKILGLGLNCGVYDYALFTNLPQGENHIKALFGRKDYEKHPLFEAGTVLNNLTEDFPACYVMGSEADILAGAQTKLMEERVKQLRIKSKIHIYKKQKRLPHVFHIKDTTSESKECMSEMTEFFYELIEARCKS
ncbi:MAG: alpha/beta hydrolase [Clostridiales bacterium]|nr:alpha/beta hydrolase [Clostridiales bacterium]